jgi:hypothetical protein
VWLPHGPSKACVLPDACRATERNGNSITLTSQATTLKWLEWGLFQKFSDNLSVVFGLFIIAG